MRDSRRSGPSGGVFALIALAVGCTNAVGAEETGVAGSSSIANGGTAIASSGAGGTFGGAPVGGNAGLGGSAGVGGGASGGNSSQAGSGGAMGGSGGTAPSGKVPIFLAQGHMGRTTVSCDDGQSWILNHSEDDAVRCFENDFDCDHSEFAGRGIASGDGHLVITWGWGHPGSVERTEDGSAWDAVLTETGTFADIAFGNGTFVANSGMTKVSPNALDWSDGGNLTFSINTRGIDFVDYDGGRFLVSGESGTTRALAWSSDGKEWHAATTAPAGCGEQYGGFAYGAGTVVLVNRVGRICYSGDGGDTWTAVEVTDYFTSRPIWTGDEFFVYQRDKLWQSSDGKAWTSESLTPAGISIGPMARSEQGTFVAANDGWLEWYEKQHFYRSTDGKVWETLEGGAFTPSHPINFIEFGYVDPGGACPAP